MEGAGFDSPPVLFLLVLRPKGPAEAPPFASQRSAEAQRITACAARERDEHVCLERVRSGEGPIRRTCSTASPLALAVDDAVVAAAPTLERGAPSPLSARVAPRNVASVRPPTKRRRASEAPLSASKRRVWVDARRNVRVLVRDHPARGDPAGASLGPSAASGPSSGLPRGACDEGRCPRSPRSDATSAAAGAPSSLVAHSSSAARIAAASGQRALRSKASARSTIAPSALGTCGATSRRRRTGREPVATRSSVSVVPS